MAASPTLVRRPAQVAEAVPAAEGTRLLYERYYDRVFGYCLYQLGSREEAEDATQTTFLWAFRGLRRGVVPRAEDSWLFTIAKNACRSRHRAKGRRRQREVVSDPHVLADISSAPLRQHDELIGLEDALARMPELQRRAILLREWRGLSYREIAAELDVSGAAVETLIFRARRSLAELLNGKPAPKRARRFAFDFGSVGVALKSALGSATGAKLAAGVAAAVIAATALGGSAERPAVQQKVPAGVPASPLSSSDVGTSGARSERKASAERRTDAHRGKGSSPSAPPAEAPQGNAPSVGQKVDEAVGSLPLAPGLKAALPSETVTALVDDAVGDVSSTVDDVTGSLP